ncbi:MAG: hypothetical protein Q4F74_01920 [Synergistaceae bacterium]|nr:hypothetical protein [Synergistaceae bacterium]
MTISYPDMTLHVVKHFKDGHTIMAPCVVSILSPDDYKGLKKAYKEVSEGLSPEIFAPYSDDELKRFLSEDGIVVGVHYKKQIISARSVKISPEWVTEFSEGLGGLDCHANTTAVTGFCAVAGEFRGNNIQFLTQYYMENLLVALGKSMLVTTIAPNNIFSLANVLNCKYCITRIRNAYGGYLRYVLKKDLWHTPHLFPHGHMTIPYHNLAQQKEALDAGYVGYKLIKRTKGMALLFGRRDRSANIIEE